MLLGIADSIVLRCFASPERTAIEVVGGVSLTYGEVWRRIRGLADAVSGCAAGRHGRMVALLLPNGADAALALAACQIAGVVAVPLNGRLTAPEMRHILIDADCRLLLTAGQFLGIARQAASGLPLEVIDAAALPTPAHAARPELGRRDAGAEPCVVGYTSGTTGFPKGAVYTHDYYTMNNYRWGWAFGLSGEHVVLIAGPMFHISYAGFALAGLTIGARVRIMPEFSAAMALDELDRHCSFAFLVPTMLRMLADEWEQRGRPPMGAARHLISAGAPVTASLLRTIMQMFPAAKIAEMYGWTEGAFATYEVKKADDLLPNSVGWPALGADVALFGEDGEPCGVGVAGEIGVRGPVPFAGYLGNPEATAAAFHRGYLMSGDIGVFQPDGRLCLVDRKKDVIITGGENVYTMEVERVLLEHPAVRECAVVGLPDERWGERIGALLVVDDPAPDTRQLLEFCRSRLAGYKVPRQFAFASELPRNSMGKVQKARVAEHLSGSGRVCNQ
ncbi:fatty-acyl-CoA synthase [Gammaproteobacteria bacterium]|nr:acyl--CoA ligase [Gammaproteobacteria bacterium]CAG0941632.1 fatty-acyl-CoA synthase [Gammaproteobacteria bacterium]